MSTETPIASVNVDDGNFVGDDQDGVYWSVAGDNGGWYVSAMVDCNSSGFTADLVTDDGPYDTEEEAMAAGKSAGTDWCIENEVDWRLIDHGTEEDLKLALQHSDWADLGSWGILEEFEGSFFKPGLKVEVINVAFVPDTEKCGFFDEGELIYNLTGTLSFKFKAPRPLRSGDRRDHGFRVHLPPRPGDLPPGLRQFPGRYCLMFNDALFETDPVLVQANLAITEALSKNLLMEAVAEIIQGATDLKAILMETGNLLHRWGLPDAAAQVTILTEALNKSPKLRQRVAEAGWTFSMPTPEQARGSDKFVF